MNEPMIPNEGQKGLLKDYYPDNAQSDLDEALKRRRLALAETKFNMPQPS